MKSVLLIGALVISAGTFAQGRSEAPKAEKELKQPHQVEVKDKGQKPQMEVKQKPEQAKEKPNGKPNDAKPKTNNGNGNAYGKDKGDMSGREFGQSRAAAAKTKAKEVKTETEAVNLIEVSIKETKATISSIEEKMIEARNRLAEKLASGELTKAVFDEKMTILMDFEKRKNTIIIGVQ